MADTFELYRQRVKAILDQEVAELEVMRAKFAAFGTQTTDDMASVCACARERVELLAVRIRLLEHDRPAEARDLRRVLRAIAELARDAMEDGASAPSPDPALDLVDELGGVTRIS